MQILWRGTPTYLAYLFATKRFFWKLLAVGFIVVYEQFQFLLFSRVAIVVLLFYILYAAIQSKRLKYYLTDNGVVVQKGNSINLLLWKDLRRDEYHVYGTPIEHIFNSRTLEFTRSYITSHTKDAWREKARFWGIKGYKSADEIINTFFEK